MVIIYQSKIKKKNETINQKIKLMLFN